METLSKLVMCIYIYNYKSHQIKVIYNCLLELDKKL